MRGYKLTSETGLSIICRCPRLVYFKENGKAQKNSTTAGWTDCLNWLKIWKHYSEFQQQWFTRVQIK